MLKRTKGCVLLTLLVVTGFAGIVSNTTLSQKERKFASGYLKETKSEFIKSLKGLSDAQLDFKPAKDQWSVRECAQHIALSEGGLWTMLQGEMGKPTNSEKRQEIKFSDEDLIKMVSSREKKVKTVEALYPEKAKWTNLEETLEAFKKQRGDLVDYIKTTTEDLRNHVLKGPPGMMDAYQLVLLVSAHTLRHTQQIKEIKSHPDFPQD